MIAENTIHPFESREGFSGIGRKGFMALILLGLMSAVIARFEFIGITVLLGLSAALAYGYVIFQRPIIGLYTALGFSFLLIGAGRYVKDVQVGLGMDLIIIVTYLAFFFKRFYGRIDWSPANRDITWISFVWFLYSVFQIFNPESSSLAAWFSGRSIGVHFFLLVPLALLFMDSVRKIRIFIIIWCVFSLLASVKGILQVHIGLDAWERGWLEEGNYKTHVLFGKLRAFSFLSDAGQFGANQGYTAVVAFITGIASKKWSSRIFFFLVAALAIYGLVISGSRGSLSVPLAGFCLFLLLKKNFALLSMGALIMSGILYFFMFTSIGQGNADIRRMRTAFDPNDASLQVRLNNQRVLKTYMASRPFGGGIGHGGVKAQRFLPNAFLSQIPTDSWYVLIWVEQGIVGLVLHISILLYVLIKACYLIMFRLRDRQLKWLMIALASGMFGVAVASYGNAVLGQMPTNILIYVSMAILLNSSFLDKEIANRSEKPLKV